MRNCIKDYNEHSTLPLHTLEQGCFKDSTYALFNNHVPQFTEFNCMLTYITVVMFLTFTNILFTFTLLKRLTLTFEQSVNNNSYTTCIVLQIQFLHWFTHSTTPCYSPSFTSLCRQWVMFSDSVIITLFLSALLFRQQLCSQKGLSGNWWRFRLFNPPSSLLITYERSIALCPITIAGVRIENI